MAELDDLDLDFNAAAQTLGEADDNNNVLDLEGAARNLNKSQAETVLDAVETEEVDPNVVRDQRAAAQELNAPVEIIEVDFDGAARELKRRRRNDTLQDHPGTQDFLSNPPNAKIASDDVAGLSRIEDLHKKSFSEKTDIIFNDPISRYIRAPIADFIGFGGSALEGIETISDAFVGLIDISPDEKDPSTIGDMMSPRALLMRGLLKVLRETGTDVPETPGEAVLQTTTMTGEALSKASKALNVENRSFGEDVAGAIGQLGAQVGATILNPFLGIGTLVTSGATETENIIKQIKKEGKKPRYGETGERLTILGGALVTAVAEKIGLNYLLNRAPPGLKNKAVRYVTDKLIAGGIEAGEETVEAALRDFIIRVGVDEERAILEDFTAREAGVAGTAGAIFRTVLGVRYAKTNQEKSAEMLDTVRDDILRQRSPEAFDQFFQSLADREGEPNVLLSAEPMVEYLVGQNENPVEFFQELGVDEKSMTVAYESGGDIQVPAGSFFTKMADNPYRDEALLNIREGTGAPTVAEMELQSQEAQERLTKVLEEMDSQDQKEINGSINRVRERFKQDAIVAGQTKPEAESAAAVWDSTFRTALDAYANDPNRTRPLQEIARDLEENVFNVRTRKIQFSERGEPLVQTLNTTPEPTDIRSMYQDPDDTAETNVLSFGEAVESREEIQEQERAQKNLDVLTDEIQDKTADLQEKIDAHDWRVDVGKRVRTAHGVARGEPPWQVVDLTIESEGLSPDADPAAGIYTKSPDVPYVLVERNGERTMLPEWAIVEIFDGPTRVGEPLEQTVDPTSDANILHQTINDENGKPLAVVHNISEEKLRHAFKMGGLPVPSLAIIDAKQRFESFGEIQLVGSPRLVDPRASRRNRVFDADVYSTRYPSSDIERTVDRDAADAAQVELDAIAEKMREGAYRPGWLQETLADTGTKFLKRERPVQQAFLRSIGVQQRVEASEEAIEGREGEFDQFVEDTYGSLITKERILDKITDTGRKYLPHNLDNVVKIMKRDLRGGERFTYGVGTIRAQAAKEFQGLRDIKDARDRIVTEADMQAFKDDTDDAFGELAQELTAFYSGDPNSFGYLDVVVEMLSDFARRGESAVEDNGFANVSDEAKQNIVDFLANLREAPTEYFEAKIQRAVSIDEFEGAIVEPETPQDIRDLLEDAGLRVVEAFGEKSEALQEFFSQELFQDEPRFQDTHRNDDRVERDKNKHGLMPYIRDYSESEPTREGKPIVIKSNNNNSTSELGKVDEVLNANPDAHTSVDAWKKMMADAYVTQDVPIPPYRFIEEINTDGIVRNLSRLTAGQINDADEGFKNAREFRQEYISGRLGVETTGKLFMWSFLSRGVSPYAQESLFIDAFPEADVWISAAAQPGFDVDQTAIDIDLGSGSEVQAREQLVTRANLQSWKETNKKRKKAGKRALPKPNDFGFRRNDDGTVNTTYSEWAKSVSPKGSGRPGAGATHNLNAFGKDFLTKMSNDVGDGTGRTKLQYIHDLMSDPNSTGKMIRREFAKIGEGVGIDNKVVSFTLLVAGFDDVMVLDRVQFRQLYNDGRFDGINIYDGYKEPGKTGSVTGSGLAKQGDGTRGILIYEAFERAIETRIGDVYAELGRDGVGSVGRYHWETWVADSGQEASHGSIGAILPDALGEKEAINNVTAKQGEYGSYAYGARYGVDGQGISYFQYTTPSGKILTFTVPQFVEFMNEIKKPKNGVVPKDYKVTETENAPWYTGEQVDSKALDKLAQTLSAGAAGKRAGTVRQAGKDTSLSDRFAATDTELYQTQTVDPPTGIGRLYSQAQQATQSLPQQKATGSQWLSHFKKSGVKDDELEFVVGLSYFLNSQKTIDKDDLLAFIEQRGIKLDEVKLGGPLPERAASLEAAEQNLDQSQELKEREYKELSYALRVSDAGLVDPEMRSGEYPQAIIDIVNVRGPSYVQKFEDKIPGIFEKAQNYYKAYSEAELAYKKFIEENKKYLAGRNFPKFSRYTSPGEKISPDREFYLTLPADLTEGNADIEDWLQPRGHRIDDPVADERLVVRIRTNGRQLEDGRRVLFIEEIQDDRGQEAREKGVRKLIPDLEERRFAYRNAASDARRVMAWYFGGLSELPMNERFFYLERLVNTAVRLEISGDRWVTSKQTGDGRRSYADFDYTAEDIAVVDRLIELERSEPEEVTSDYGDLLAEKGVPDRPFLGSNKVVPLALKRMLIQATEDGDDAIAWTSGEMQTERYRLSNMVSSIEVLDVNEDEAFVIVNQRSGGPVALPGVQTEMEDLGDDPGTLDEIIRDFRGSIVNIVPLNKLPEFFGKDLSDKMVEGGRMQTYSDLDLDIGGAGMKKFYNKIAVNAANKIGKKYKAKTEVGQLDEQDVWVLPLTDPLKETILGEGLPMMQAAKKDDPLGSFDPVRRVINLFEKSDYSTVLHESGHAFVNILENLAERDDAPQRIRDNYQAMLDWVGAESSADMDLRVNGDKAREKQERLARAFEAYLMEGKAPSNALRSAFNQFKNWLSKIYSNLRQLDVTMDDEIRQVFDRMLATDAEIDDLIAVNEFTAEASPSIFAMMDMEEREKAASLQISARDRARAAAALERQKHDALLKSEKFAEETDFVRAEVTDQVYAEQKYAAFYFLTRGQFYGDRETPDALRGKRLSRSKLLEFGLTKEELRALPRANGKSGKALYSSNEEDAQDPAALAAYFAYDTSEALVADMRTIVLPETEIERRTAEIMAGREQYSDPAEDGTLRSISEAALFNAEQAERLELQLDALAREAGQEKQSRAFLKAVADRMFAEEPIGDLLSQYKFAGASRRAARAAERAAARKDFQKAFIEKRKEILNFELHRRAVKAKDEVAKARTELNKLKRQKIDPKRVAADYVGNVKALLNFYEFGAQNKTSEIDTAAAQNIADFIQKKQESNASIILPGDLMSVVGKDEESGKPILAFQQKFWKTMTLSELRALRDLTRNLMKQGRDSSQSAKEAIKERGRELAGNILSSTKKRRERPEDREDLPRKDLLKKTFRFATFAEHRKLESMLRQLDGFQANGPMWTAIFDKLAEASDNKAVLISTLLKRQEEMGELLTEKQRKSFATGEGAVAIKALGGFHLRLETRMAIALNWGSESSREAILDDQYQKAKYGDLWNETAIEEILGTLDTNALNYIDAVWKLVDSFWEDVTLPNGRVINGVKSLEKRTTGIAPPKVEPLTFTVNGRIMSGGYYPLSYDNLKDTRTQGEREDTMKRLTETGGFSRAQTTHGHTIARIGSGGRPVRHDLAVVNQHLDQVTQDLTYREAVKEAADVLLNADVKAAIETTMGRPFYDSMKEILVRSATGQLASTELGPFNKRVMNARINFTTAIMGFNVRTILTQPLGLNQSIAEIGVKDVGHGMAWFYTSEGEKIANQVAYIHSLSAYMGERARTMTRELDDIANSLQRKNEFDKIRAKGFAPMTYVDMVVVAYPTWYGAYNKAMQGRVDGINESDQVQAIKYADQVVRITQSAGGAQNMSMVQQRSETMKLMTLMYSYFNSTYQMQAEAWARARQDGSSVPRAMLKGDFIAQTMLLQFYPALMGSIVLDLWPDDDEQDEDGVLFSWAKWSLKSLLSYTSGQFVFVRDFAGYAINPHFGIDLTPMESVAKSVGRIPGKIEKVIEEPGVVETSELAKSLVIVGGQLKGFPGTNQIAKIGDYFYKWTYGELKNPPDSIAEGVWKAIMTGDR